MNRLTAIVLLVVMPVLFSSCSSKLFGGKKNKKKSGAQAVTDTVKTTPAPVVTGAPVATAPAANKLVTELTPLWNKRMQYRTFSGKAKVNFDGPDGNVGFSANFRIAKDSLIWAHISAVGGLYSVARILVTRDSFFMVNYDQKQVTFIPLADAAKILPVAVGFKQLQSLFLGEPLADGVITSAEAKDSAWSLRTEDDTYMQQVTYLKADSTMVFGHLQTRKPNGPQAMVDYNNYEAIGSRKLSTNRIVHIQNGVNNYTLDMDFVNPEFDKELEYPFSMPKNFAVKNQ